MKYTQQQYLESGFYSDDDIENYKAKIVKCRKEHKCVSGCEVIIKIGEPAFYESGFLEGKPVSAYTCLPCIDAHLDRVNGVYELEAPKWSTNETEKS